MANSTENLDPNAVLDQIMLTEGLSNRFEARLWLKEHLDTTRRLKLTEGRSRRLVKNTAGSGGQSRQIKVENPQRKLISATGRTLPHSERPSFEAKPITPVISAPSTIGFAAALQERQLSKPRKLVTKLERSHARNKGIDPDKGIPVHERKERPKPTQPKPDSDSYVVFEILKRNKWHRADSITELVNHPRFQRFEDVRRRKKVIGAQVTMVTQRYHPDSRDS